MIPENYLLDGLSVLLSILATEIAAYIFFYFRQKYLRDNYQLREKQLHEVYTPLVKLMLEYDQGLIESAEYLRKLKQHCKKYFPYVDDELCRKVCNIKISDREEDEEELKKIIRAVNQLINKNYYELRKELQYEVVKNWDAKANTWTGRFVIATAILTVVLALAKFFEAPDKIMSVLEVTSMVVMCIFAILIARYHAKGFIEKLRYGKK